ncbi:AbrB/MazE/SpoVT family DNA-binding domain-containing protein [Fusibacter tunisiensis]|uniref:Transcriptional pleiotropic regulator of transition state genes n=1 Tax=Fusibacter tunisiensis TaxID=1008308 RepID=A0ABS2MQ23_9FIRM|nr:AbrB/MazE/SpoVT family DNA-binding domain-containing protein [Fusibacter tunisiensis]MBM7561485.1 transcriptional pleiotropic regulator of transition state genes [Fusibacter tunisiensis]
MKSTGIVRKLDELGRIVIPIEVRRVLNIDVKDSLEIYTESDTIIFKKHTPHCFICGSSKNTIIFKGKLICRDCINVIKEAGQ